MSNLLFICEGNRCISQLASSYVAQRFLELGKVSEFGVASAGMRVHKGDDVPAPTRQAMEEMGVAPLAYFPRQLSLKDIRVADLIICMNGETMKKLLASYRSAEGKVIHLMGLSGKKEDVFEPRQNVEANKNCLAMMKPALDILIQRLQ